LLLPWGAETGGRFVVVDFPIRQRELECDCAEPRAGKPFRVCPPTINVPPVEAFVGKPRYDQARAL